MVAVSFKSGEIALFAPCAQQLHEGDGASAIGRAACGRVGHMALVIVIARRTSFQELAARLAHVEDRIDPVALSLLGRLDRRNILAKTGFNKIGEVDRLLVQHVREVRGHAGLRMADDEAVGEAAAVQAVQRGHALCPFIGESHASDPADGKTRSLGEIRADFETGGEDQAVQGIFGPSNDHAVRGDPLDTPAAGVRKGNVRSIEDLEILVMKAGPLAEQAEPGL